MNVVMQTQVKPNSTPASLFIPIRIGLQRKVAGDGYDENCKKWLTLERSSPFEADPSELSPVVCEMLNSPDETQLAGKRAFFEPCFGHNFNKVRVHTENEEIGRLITSGSLRAKLRISQPGDIYEQEADRMAEKVVSSTPPMNRKCMATSCQLDDDMKKPVQPRNGATFNTSVASVANNFIQNLGSGQPLDKVTREYFEQRFGHDFSCVRVHTDTNAVEATRRVNARAFTLGRNVVFGKGQYSPASHNGQKLLAHELMHTIQQDTTLPLTGIVQRDFSSSMKRGLEMYSGLNDEGTHFAEELMRWRLIGFGFRFTKRPDNSDWNDFMVSRPEIHRAMASKFVGMVSKFGAGGPTGSEWLGGWKYFNDSITDVRLNELESMRLTLHGCHRIDIEGRYFVETEGSDTIVKLDGVRFTWIDRADLHPGTTTELESGARIDDREFTHAGWDYDILIQFEMPSISIWRISGANATHIKGWPPEAGVPDAGFRG